MIRRFAKKVECVLDKGTFLAIWSLFTLIGLVPELVLTWRSSLEIGGVIFTVLRNMLESLPFAGITYYWARKKGETNRPNDT